MTHFDDLALVLGGGGAVGNAWEIGVLAGLATAGADVAAQAELVIGTSAGATAAAQVCSGTPIEELYEAATAPVPHAARAAAPISGTPVIDVQARMREINATATSALELQRAMGAFGLECDAILSSAGEQRRATVAARLPSQDWPERNLRIITLDAHTAELVVLERESGAELVDAVTASTALPGLAPTHPVNGRRLIDGGIRSVDNADLAEGHARVLIVSPLGARRQPEGLSARFEGLRRPKEWGTDLGSQVARLETAGAQVEVITPDQASAMAMGENLMDLKARVPAARAGFEQGRLSAQSLFAAGGESPAD